MIYYVYVKRIKNKSPVYKLNYMIIVQMLRNRNAGRTDDTGHIRLFLSMLPKPVIYS